MRLIPSSFCSESPLGDKWHQFGEVNNMADVCAGDGGTTWLLDSSDRLWYMDNLSNEENTDPWQVGFGI